MRNSMFGYQFGHVHVKRKNMKEITTARFVRKKCDIQVALVELASTESPLAFRAIRSDSCSNSRGLQISPRFLQDLEIGFSCTISKAAVTVGLHHTTIRSTYKHMPA